MSKSSNTNGVPQDLKLMKSRPNRRLPPSKSSAARKSLGQRMGGIGPAFVTAGRATGRAAYRIRKPALALFVLAGAVVGVIAGRRYLLRSQRFALKQIVLTPSPYESDAEMARYLGVAVGDNVFRVDLATVEHGLEQDPWIAQAHARRELPDRLVVDLTFREAHAAVALGPLYLADADGHLFKRAADTEADGLPIITGLTRDQVRTDPDATASSIRRALTVLGAYSATGRPTVGEVHVDTDGSLDLITADGATEILLGQAVDLQAQLARFDVLWSSLGADAARARVVHLENESRPDRVTVRLYAQSSENPAAPGAAAGAANPPGGVDLSPMRP
jgi:cell division septal protein FtsQ